MIDNLFQRGLDLFFSRSELKVGEHINKEPIAKVKAVKEKLVEVKLEEVIKNESEYARILRANGGVESNIPIRSHYWKIT